MDSRAPSDESDKPVESLVEFFERIQKEGGVMLDEEDHGLIVETIRMDRDHGH